ncbi:MAG: TlpA family protein disulfide reductase [Rubrivivax sp.]|nr:TlpA family protein disulfide reductase [Rubrivivax sp.]
MFAPSTARPATACRIDRRQGLQWLAASVVLGAPATRVARAADAFEWRPWPPSKRAPPLNLPLLDGTRWQLSSQAGRVVLANFWASWCAPCRDEMPSLMRLAAQRAADGLVVMGVNYRESASTVARFLDGLSLKLPTLLDRDGAIAVAYTPRIFPSTVVFDRQGKPVGTVVGEIDWDGDAAARILAPLLRTT